MPSVVLRSHYYILTGLLPTMKALSISFEIYVWYLWKIMFIIYLKFKNVCLFRSVLVKFACRAFPFTSTSVDIVVADKV